ncbi:MAG: OmpA family protein [Thiobacillaceae bacterium]|nr:OmpA family protein [Thiobacillaceae bacterium]
MSLHPPRPKTRPLILALLSASLAMAAQAAQTAGASDTPPSHPLTQLVLYAVAPYCQVLANGLKACQPVGVVGPTPNAPAGALVPVPLAPPSIQPAWPQAPIVTPYGPNPYLSGPVPFPFMPAPWPPMPLPPAQTAAVPPAPAATPSIPPSPPTSPAGTPATPATAATGELDRRAAAAPAEPPAPGPSIAPMAAAEQAQPAQPLLAAAPTPPRSEATVPMPTVSAATEVKTAGPTPPGPSAATQGTQESATRSPVVLFAFDSAELTDAARQDIDGWLATLPKQGKIIAVGHADRLGPSQYNLDLSRRRAEAVRQYLVRKGVDARRIVLEARGETQPVKQCRGGATPQTIKCLAPNRRVEMNP